MIKLLNLPVFFSFICVLAVSALGEEKTESKARFRFSGLPALGFGSDTGFGGGAIINMYEDAEGYEPYKLSLSVKGFFTSKFVNSHMIKVDRVRAFGLPWRLIGRIGFYSTPSQNYCGLVSDADCSENRAKLEADRLGLRTQDREVFTNNFYKNRYMSLYGELFSSWLLWQGFAQLSLINSYRGNYYWQRDFSNIGPYENSLYARDFPSDKIRQEGYLSTLEIGLMLDSRDNESAPTSGFWLESSVRGAAKFTGSAWNFFGANLSARFYWSLDSERKLVIASQSIIDAVVGNLPYDALSRVGGSQALNDYNAFGGSLLGRGLREQLQVGRFKAIEQLELRYNFWSFKLWRQNFEMVAAAFTDIGFAAWDYQRFLRDMKAVQIGFGPGLRIYWDKTFVIRADLGMSPAENFYPRFYLVVGNIF